MEPGAAVAWCDGLSLIESSAGAAAWTYTSCSRKGLSD